MKMNDLWMIGRGLTVGALLLLAGCANDGSICAGGDEVTVDGEGYCVYRRAVVVENGFECPPERPNLTQDGGIGVCSAGGMVPGGDLEQIGHEFRDVDPDYDTCILDFECKADEVCEPNGCVAVGPDNSSNSNSTTNNTTTTNNATTSGCQSSADCATGQTCEGGVCLGACGGFAGFACMPDEWCDYPDGSMCGAADQLGVCRPRPDACAQVLMPVCGCDAMDYSNACEAQAAGVDVGADGACN